jgi:hypothetical protein
MLGKLYYEHGMQSVIGNRKMDWGRERKEKKNVWERESWLHAEYCEMHLSSQSVDE